jgi:hypothetical protein
LSFSGPLVGCRSCPCWLPPPGMKILLPSPVMKSKFVWSNRERGCRSAETKSDIVRVHMAWIPCEDKLFSNPMTARLAGKMGWTINAAVGAILRLRCWCIDFAPDGDLRPFAPAEIATALGEPAARGERVVAALIESQWLETTPYFRVSAWWETTGMFLRGRFRRDPAVWKRIQKMYNPPCEDGSPGGGPRDPEEGEVSMQDAACPGASPVEPDQSDTGPVHEQLLSSSRPGAGPLAPILSQLIPSFPSYINNNPHHPPPHHPGVSDNDVPDTEAAGSRQPLNFSRLIREVFERAGIRRFSFADEEELRRLAARHGEAIIEACQHLHGGITNVPAYLRTVLEGSNNAGILAREAGRLLRQRS